ncbi:MAG: hypothetical protein D6814_15240 [Calditrichaeota bacterium]|nr:MAG: hypothetical protein D6814_15240 [Calditrichota bacterium]
MPRLKSLLIILLVLVTSGLNASPLPDVKQATETRVHFKGTLGTIMRFLGANKPIRTVNYLKGNVLRTDKLDKKGKKVEQSTIIDLDKEVFVTINHKKKTYSQMTFAEWRQMLQSSIGHYREAGEEQEEESSESEEKPEMKLNFKLDIQTPGDKKDIAGNRAEKVILKMSAEAEAQEKESEAGAQGNINRGGLVITSTQWLSTSAKGLQEMKDFRRRLAAKLGMEPEKMGLQKIMDQLMQSNPELAEAMKKVEQEKDKLNGISLESHTVFATWAEGKSGEMGSEESEQMAPPKSVGGLLKGFGKKFGKKKKKKKDASQPNVLLETTTKTLSYSTQPISMDLFAIPQNYKLLKK